MNIVDSVVGVLVAIVVVIIMGCIMFSYRLYSLTISTCLPVKYMVLSLQLSY